MKVLESLKTWRFNKNWESYFSHKKKFTYYFTCKFVEKNWLVYNARRFRTCLGVKAP